MTPKQRKDHRIALVAAIEESGFAMDQWGNWKNKSGKYRIKLKSINMRLESKVGGSWMKVTSTPWSTLDPRIFGQSLLTRTNI